MAVLIQTEVKAVADDIDGSKSCLGNERNYDVHESVFDPRRSCEIATNIWDHILEPGIGREQFGEPGCCDRLCIHSSIVYFAFCSGFSNFYQLNMGCGKPWKCTPASGLFRARSSRGAQVSLSHCAAGVPRSETLFNVREPSESSAQGDFLEPHSRHIISTRPGRSVLDVVISGHMFGCDHDVVLPLLRQ